MPRLRQNLVAELSRVFAAAANAVVAAGQKKYMRNQFEFLGLSTPVRTSLEAEVFRKHVVRSEEELVNTINALWGKEHREFRYSAMNLASKYKKLWTPAMLSTFERMLRQHSWWDTVDAISSKLVGQLLQTFPQLAAQMENWIQDDFMWIRRCAIIFQLSYKATTDEAMLFRFCKHRMHEKEFFIQKAIGWALRQYSKTNPEAVRRFIEENEDNLSALSKREGGKYC